MNQTELDDWEARLLRRLDVVVDDRWPYRVRLAAVTAIQATLGPQNPLRFLSPDALLLQMTEGANLRPFLNRDGRYE